MIKVKKKVKKRVDTFVKCDKEYLRPLEFVSRDNVEFSIHRSGERQLSSYRQMMEDMRQVTCNCGAGKKMGRRPRARQSEPIVREDLKSAHLVWLELTYAEPGAPLTVREDELLPEVLEEIRRDARFICLKPEEKGWSGVWALKPIVRTRPYIDHDGHYNPSLPDGVELHPVDPELKALWRSIPMADIPRRSPKRAPQHAEKNVKVKKQRKLVITCNTHLVESGMLGDTEVKVRDTSKKKGKRKMPVQCDLGEDEY